MLGVGLLRYLGKLIRADEEGATHTFRSVNPGGTATFEIIDEAGLTMIPFLIVPATRAPTVTAPRNSNMAAPMMACLKVRERDETEVAQELATSSIGSEKCVD